MSFQSIFAARMKRFLLLLISITYLILSIGFISYSTYCQNNLTNISVLINTHDCIKCENCKTEKCKQDTSKECCKHAKHLSKLSIDQQNSKVKINLTPQQTAILSSIITLSFINWSVDSTIESYPVINTLPLEGQAPINILHCTYLI